MTHQWLPDGGSTLDLVGDGLTLLVADDADGWSRAAAGLGVRAPIDCHPVGSDVTNAIDIPPGGDLLLRPDGRPAARWTDPATPPIAELAALGLR